jgi:hypothetical protein
MAQHQARPKARIGAHGAKIKNGFAPKVCARCQRPFEWRKKWAKDWEQVKYCSDACRSGK